MNRSLLLVTVLSMTACTGAEPETEVAPERAVTYFEGGRIILGDGTPAIEDAAMVVDNGEITAVGPRSEIEHPPGAERYDFTGYTLMPFLHNMHGHVGYLDGISFSAANYSRESILLDLDRYLYYGVGSVAVMGSDMGDEAFVIREEQRSGALGGTRLLTAGRGIARPGGYPVSAVPALAGVPYEVSSADEAREAVRELAARQVDFVKVWVDDGRTVTGIVFRQGRPTDRVETVPKLSAAVYSAVIEEAHANGIPVVAHVRYLADAKGLVAAGVDGLVHSIRDRAVDQELIDAMLANDVFYVPTLTAHQSQFIWADEPEWLGETSMRESVRGTVLASLNATGVALRQGPDPNLPSWRREFATAMENVKTLYDAGVRIGFGTDSGGTNRFPGYFEHREMELLVEAGLTPSQAIQLATEGAAQLLGFEDMGALEAGNRGNFLVVAGDPLTEITASRDIAEVFLDGQRVERAPMMTRFTM